MAGNTDYTVGDFKQYMRSRMDKTGDALFEFSFQGECRRELERMGVDPKSGEGLLFSFASIAGGWETEVGRRLIGSEENGLNLTDNFDEIAATDLERVREVGDGTHSHRNANGARPDVALKSLQSLQFAGESPNSMNQLFTSLEESSDSFSQGMSVFQQVDTFGALSAFDFLEVAIRVNGQSGIVPSNLQAAHVDRNGPQKALQKMLANEVAPGTAIQSAEGQKLLDDLVDFAEADLGLNHTAAIFDVESCLCTYHGELEEGDPEWQGGCT